MSTIDTLLYRPLKSGIAFEGLIPVYQGTDFKFDKSSDNSTTYDTLRYMAQWSTKYASQMKRIAPLMRGKTIEETANNIYQFLYNHFQYKLDGETQNLYSPSAAWHFRKTGFDCKTYSILASTILQNLNITHAFRMVQQAGIMPGEWSHVYVVIPNGNQTAIIDATTHTNKEVSFTKKHDYTMKHRGLASPYINGLGCACQGTSLNKTGLGSPATMATTVANFHAFLNEIEGKGVPKEVTSRMLDLVKWNVQNGIDPNMQEIIAKAYAGTNQGLGYIDPTPSLTPATATYNAMSYSLPTNNYTAPTSSAFSGIVSSGTSMLNNASVGGVNVGGLITNVATGNYVGAAIDVLKAVVPIDKTFGQVFANGFNLSCWGSSAAPSATKEWAQKDFPMAFEASLGKGLSQGSLDLFLDAMNHLEDYSRYWAPKMNSCSTTGITQYADAAKKAKEETLTAVRGMVQLVQQPTVQTNAVLPLKFSQGAFNNDYQLSSYRKERYLIVWPQAVTQASPTTTQNGSVANGSGTADATNSANTTTTAKKSSATIPLLIGAGALALKFLI